MVSSSTVFFILYAACWLSAASVRQQAADLEQLALQNSPNLLHHDDQSVRKFSKRQANCTFYSCFDIYNCKSIDEDNIGVYVLPFYNRSFAAGFSHLERQYGIRTSLEFLEILDAVKHSKFNVEQPGDACVHILPLDFTNELTLPTNFGSLEFQRILTENHWPFGNGANFLFFNFVLAFNTERSRLLTELGLGNALVASASFNTRTFRAIFDVAIPFPLRAENANMADLKVNDGNSRLESEVRKRDIFLLFSQPDVPMRFERFANELVVNHTDVQRIRECVSTRANNRNEKGRSRSDVDSSPIQSDGGANDCVTSQNLIDAYRSSEFCVLFRSNAYSFSKLPTLLKSGCIPVVIASWFVPPFEELATWSTFDRIAIHLLETDTHMQNAYKFLKSVASNTEQLAALRHTGAEFVARFNSLDSIVNGVLRTLSDRVHPTRISSRLFGAELQLSGVDRTDL